MITWESSSVADYVACFYGEDGDQPGDCYYRVGYTTKWQVLQAGSVVAEFNDEDEAVEEAEDLNDDLSEELGDADLGDGAASVHFVTEWWIEDGDDACRTDEYGPYSSREEAIAEAERMAAEQDEAEPGEDADDMRRRQLKETAGDPSPDGEYCVWWETAGDDSHVVDRYDSEEAADAAADLANEGLRSCHQGRLLCRYTTRTLVDGGWVEVAAGD